MVDLFLTPSPSLDGLPPAAETHGEHHLSIYGLVLGMTLMAAGLLLFKAYP